MEVGPSVGTAGDSDVDGTARQMEMISQSRQTFSSTGTRRAEREIEIVIKRAATHFT
jgi:hypothetical protein